MDVYCPKCGEPFDPYEFHDAAKTAGTTYAAIAAAFRRNGCAAVDMACTPRPDSHRAALAAEVLELMGDDIDGAAAILEDAERLGIL